MTIINKWVGFILLNIKFIKGGFLSRLLILGIKKYQPKLNLVQFRLVLVPLAGLASLEPPAKQSTGLFFRLMANTQHKRCLLLIQVRPKQKV